MSAQDASLKIIGMECDGCQRAVTAAISGVDGVSDVVVNLEGEHATFRIDGDKATIEQVITEIEDFGYGATV